MKKCSNCEKKYKTETLFLLDGKLYCAFCLIYKLADDGIFGLVHDDYEEKGVEVIK